jgi:CRP/FNR family transcriptional regulator
VLTESQTRSFLASIKPFKSLPQEELARIARLGTSHTFLNGENVFREGDPAKSVWIVYKGRISVFKESPVHGRFPIESLGPGEIFGALCRLGNDTGVYPCTATVAGNSTVIRLPNRSFFDPYAGNADFARETCSLCATRLASSLNQRNVDQAPASIRIAQTLFRLHHVYGTTIPLTKRELAELVGTALETTFRELSKLRRAGVLQSERGRILVKKAHQLKASVS